MSSRILIAIDESIFSEKIANRAIMFAQANQARLMLLHVSTNADKIDADYLTSSFVGNLEDKAKAPKLSSIDLWRSYCDVIRRKGAIADLRAPSGDPGQQICHVAEQWGADLILMERHHLSASGKQLLNSVSSYVLDHAPCALLIVPAHVNLPIISTTIQSAMVQEVA
jgi:nucleotide-binding universal stress UspA family protein